MILFKLIKLITILFKWYNIFTFFYRLDKLWWYPPQYPLSVSQPPSPNRYFAQPLLLWMPRKLWCVKLYCPHPGCHQKNLTSAGIYPHICQVLDIDGYYNLAAEYLECKNCNRKVLHNETTETIPLFSLLHLPPAPHLSLLTFLQPMSTCNYSPHCPSYISYGISAETLFKNWGIPPLLIISFILPTFLYSPNLNV